MRENKTRLLLILSQDMLDQARVIAGRATTVLKLPGSLQIVFRALIGGGAEARKPCRASCQYREAGQGRSPTAAAERVAQVKAGSWRQRSLRTADCRTGSSGAPELTLGHDETCRPDEGDHSRDQNTHVRSLEDPGR